MAWAQAQYATAAEFKAATGQTDGPPANDTTFEALLKAASDRIDDWTGTWWNARAVTLTGQASDDSPELWLPARATTLTSVTESGKALTRITSPTGSGDYYLGPGAEHLIRSQAPATQSFRPSRRTYWWSYVPNDIVIVGTFGNTAPDGSSVLSNIKSLTIAVAASIGEMRRRTFVNTDGSVSETPVSSYPAWIGEAVRAIRRRSIGQPPIWTVSWV